jgi:hypothetical protein
MYQIIGQHSLIGNPPQLPQYNPGENDHPDEGNPHEADAYISIDQSTIHDWYSPLNDPLVLILLSILTELRSLAWAFQNSPFI